MEILLISAPKPFQKFINSPAPMGYLVFLSIPQFPEGHAIILENGVVPKTPCAPLFICYLPFHNTWKDQRFFSGLTVSDYGLKISCPIFFSFHQFEHFRISEPIFHKARVRAWKTIQGF